MLILKDRRKLNNKDKIYHRCFKKEMTEEDIVTFLLNTNDELYETYQTYQTILYSLDTRNKKIFLNTIHNKNKKISLYMKKAIHTFNNMEKYIINAFDYKYSNGIVEGTNNLIKQLKHTACDYRKFTRVMLIKGTLNPIKA
ncbi:MAG: transposase [Bacilli bacterium]|nr:transposase [Bacilli bacterium]